MQALFVHGMGRSPLSGWPLLRKLRRAGLRTGSFAYWVSLEDFAGIRDRLIKQIAALAAGGDYVLIGHSLGGVLIRAALNALPMETRQPSHVFLLGSPLRPARLAQKLGAYRLYRLYRLLTGDCGQLLSSAVRMGEIGSVPAPTTGIAGIRSLPWKPDPFNGEANDGVVAVSEVSADWLTDQVRIEIAHTLLPSSNDVGEIILDRLRRYNSAIQGGEP